MRVYVYVACSMYILHGLVSHAPSHHKRLRLRFRVQGLGYRVWGLGFGVWGLVWAGFIMAVGYSLFLQAQIKGIMFISPIPAPHLHTKFRLRVVTKSRKHTRSMPDSMHSTHTQSPLSPSIPASIANPSITERDALVERADLTGRLIGRAMTGTITDYSQTSEPILLIFYNMFMYISVPPTGKRDHIVIIRCRTSTRDVHAAPSTNWAAAVYQGAYNTFDATSVSLERSSASCGNTDVLR